MRQCCGAIILSVFCASLAHGGKVQLPPAESQAFQGMLGEMSKIDYGRYAHVTLGGYLTTTDDLFQFCAVTTEDAANPVSRIRVFYGKDEIPELEMGDNELLYAPQPGDPTNMRVFMETLDLSGAALQSGAYLLSFMVETQNPALNNPLTRWPFYTVGKARPGQALPTPYPQLASGVLVEDVLEDRPFILLAGHAIPHYPEMACQVMELHALVYDPSLTRATLASDLPRVEIWRNNPISGLNTRTGIFLEPTDSGPFPGFDNVPTMRWYKRGNLTTGLSTWKSGEHLLQLVASRRENARTIQSTMWPYLTFGANISLPPTFTPSPPPPQPLCPRPRSRLRRILPSQRRLQP